MEFSLPLFEYQEQLRFEQRGGETFVWDAFRKKYLKLLPEEFVRQLLALYLHKEKGYPVSHLALEYSLRVYKRQRRCDILAFNPAFQPALLVECKAPSVALSQAVFEQIARYNQPLQVPYLLLCNGPAAYCCKWQEERWRFLSEIPAYKDL